MKTGLIKVWNSLSNVGVYSGLSNRDVRITRLINRFAACILILMMASFIYQTLKHLIIAGKILPHSFLMLATFAPFALVFWFNKRRNYKSARFVIIVHALINNLLWSFTNVGQEANIYTSNIILAIPIMIFFKDLKDQILLLILTHLFFVGSFYVDQNFSPFIIKDQVNPSLNIIIYATLVLFSFLMLRFFNIEINNAETKLELKNTELEDFTRVASHDMKEPLRTINSFSSLLRKRHGPELSSSASNYLSYIESGSERLNLLLKDLSSYSAINFDNLELNEVDLNKVLENVKLDLILRISDTATIIENDTLPIILGRESHMTQLFLNLISNAIKFQPKEGNQRPFISINYDTKGRHHLITVKDNGIGISKENMEKVFTKFKRLHSRKEYEGTGLGLATCKRIAELYGGDIFVESALGSGSTFKVMLPIHKNVSTREKLQLKHS